MSLREEVALYSELSGNDGSRTPIMIIGAYLDGYEKGKAEAQIIRCRDCKHYQFADNRAFGMPVKMCKWFDFEDVDDDDFCSFAERMEVE